jgi:hypothetical protein
MDGNRIDAIREAFASSEYAKARRLWDEHAAALEASIRGGSATQAMLTEAGELVECARLMAKVRRSDARAELGEARAAVAYAGAPGQVAPHVRAVF